jgi:dihydroflavonol-4-reductase
MGNVLVVGATGLLGRPLVAELRRRGHRVTGVGRRPGNDRVADVTRLSVDGWAELLDGQDGAVFAAGADDRSTPPAPAERHFTAGNVTPVERMMRAGCRRAVILGSYFLTMNRRWPELRLPERHPYVASRVAQERVARQAGVPVATIEIPFVAGAAPGRKSVFAPALPLFASRVPLAVPPGGTAVVSSRAVAEAAAGAFERSADGAFPVAEANLTWSALVARLAELAGRRPPVRVRRLPPAVFDAALRLSAVGYRLRRREPGMSPAHLAEFFTRDLFVDPAVARDRLGVDIRDIDPVLRETVAADRAPAG